MREDEVSMQDKTKNEGRREEGDRKNNDETKKEERDREEKVGRNMINGLINRLIDKQR